MAQKHVAVYNISCCPYTLKKEGITMICPKCKSANVSVQVINQTKLKTKHHNIFWWLFIGWWWVPVKWVFLLLHALIVKIFAPKRYKTKNVAVTMCTCQQCAYTWKA